MDDEQKRLAEELLISDKSYPGFAKLLFFGIFDSKHIFPFYQISSAEEAVLNPFLDKVSEFAQNEIDPEAIDRNASIPDEVINGLGKLGVLGMTVPKEHGGLGMSQHAYCRTAEIISRRCGSTTLFINAHQSIGLKALLLFGTDEQKNRWLSPLAKGEQIAAFSLTEPNAGSDASGVETRAVYDSEKKVYRINGKKQWTTNGSIAKVLTVMAKTEVDTPQGKQEKVTAFLVTPDMPGFKVTNHALEKVGMRGTKTANLEFQDLHVPENHVLGPLGGGLKVCLTVLDYGRTTFGAACTGAAKFLVEQAVDHARNRYQFKRPLASFGLVKKKIAEMSALVYAMDASTYLTAGLIDKGVDEFMLESAILKVFTSEALWNIVFETMQIFGGRSFFTDKPLERMMRDARLNTIGEGSNEVLRVFIAVAGMRDVGLQFKSVLDSLKNPFSDMEKLWNFGKSSFKRIQTQKIPIQSSIFKKEASELGKAVQQFGYAVVKVLGMYRENILEQQLVLERIANASIALYTMSAVLSKIDTDLHNRKALENEVSLAKRYCRMALDNFRANLNDLFTNDDDNIEALSDLITGVKPR